MTLYYQCILSRVFGVAHLLSRSVSTHECRSLCLKKIQQQTSAGTKRELYHGLDRARRLSVHDPEHAQLYNQINVHTVHVHWKPN